MKFQALGSNYDFDWAWNQLFTLGSKTDSKQLTKLLEQRYGGHAYLYSKGRNALSQAVQLGNEDGVSKIAINGMTCSVVVEAITATGAEPIYLDVHQDTAHFTAIEFEEALKKHSNISAVVVQNTYGHTIDIAPIEAAAHRHNVLVIEDLAHCVGQSYPDGRETGTVGDIVMLSFGRDKVLDVVNGGALIVRSPQLNRSMQPPSASPSILNQLRDRIYPILTWKVRRFYEIGLGKALLVAMYKTGMAVRSAEGGIDRAERLPHWQAKLALRRLAMLDTLNEHREKNMHAYQQYLGDELLSTNSTIRGAIAVRERQAALHELHEAGYELSDTWYDTPIGPARKYADIEYPEQDCTQSVWLANHVINLPTHAEITAEDTAAIAAIVRKYV